MTNKDRRPEKGGAKPTTGQMPSRDTARLPRPQTEVQPRQTLPGPGGILPRPTSESTLRPPAGIRPPLPRKSVPPKPRTSSTKAPPPLPSPGIASLGLPMADAQRMRLTQFEAELSAMRSTMAAQQGLLSDLRGQLERQQHRLDGVETTTEIDVLPDTEHFNALVKASAELGDRMRRKFAEFDIVIREQQTRIDSLAERISRQEEGSEATRLRMRMDRLDVHVRELNQRISGLEQGSVALQLKLTERESTDEVKRVQTERLGERVQELRDEFEDALDQAALTQLNTRMDELETLVVHQAQSSGSVTPASSTKFDADFTRIKGIGPKYAEALRRLGIQGLQAMAAWTSDDEERIAEALGIKVSRIRNAAWVFQAQNLGADQTADESH